MIVGNKAIAVLIRIYLRNICSTCTHEMRYGTVFFIIIYVYVKAKIENTFVCATRVEKKVFTWSAGISYFLTNIPEKVRMSSSIFLIRMNKS